MVDTLHYIRKLTAFLVASVTLNMLLLGFIFYFTLSERPPTPYFELKPANGNEQQKPLAIDHSDSEVIRYFRRMPLQWLVLRLNNTKLVENGYTQRDLALASLVAFHYFDLDRAFTGLPNPEQKRLIGYGQFRDGRAAELVVYPGLSDKYFEAARAFAMTERWPVTSKGLFLALQKEEKEEYDPSLLDAFFMTSVFSTVEMLFTRSEQPIGREELLKVILEGNWNLLLDFVEQQKKSHDLSSARRQNFLLEYAKNKSKAAAQLLLKTDGVYAARKFDDSQILMLLQLVEEKSPQAEQFVTSLLKSPRSDAVLKLAADKFQEYGGMMIHESNLSKGETLAHFKEPEKEKSVLKNVSAKKQSFTKSMAQSSTVSKTFSTKRPSTAIAAVNPKDFYYVIQEGDNLWKISRRYHVDIEVLRSLNQLKTDAIHPGKTLRIPKNS
jgi:LysM repeat protein